jgi:hypothetical protein
MEIDPVPENIRQSLRQHFRDVKDEPSQGNYYVFSLKLPSGAPREMKVHRNLFIFSELVSAYLREHDCT